VTDTDIAIIGAGAAGLATAIFTRRLNAARRVVVFDGKDRPGAKILVSGGSRCNVTNTTVAASDFSGGSAHAIGLVLKDLSVPATIAFFREIGVPLHEENEGKLFPDTNRSRDVLDALLRELRRVGAELRAGCRVLDVSTAQEGFELVTSQGRVVAGAVVLASGGLSLPKTGSDGWGYGVAARLGHTIVPTTPGLVPLTLARDGATIHERLAGVAQPVRLELSAQDQPVRRVEGAMLWTHAGISGPAALDLSRHWLRADLEGRKPRLRANLAPAHRFETLESAWLSLQQRRPRLGLEAALAHFVPRAVAEVAAAAYSLSGSASLGALTRDERRRVVHGLLAWPLAVTGSRGYNFAEVTAGGVRLAEVSPRSMESRVRPGLYLVGEVLDVDGRLGGFNFQWAWSSAHVAATALAARQ
jgi:predicted Rossmann fold flavoprotein